MKHQAIAGTMSIFALIASSIWTPVQAVPFSPPPGNGSPNTATGGASRGSLFSNPRNPTARRSVGGASRGSMFVNRTNRRVQSGVVGGASRGGFFRPSRTNASPRTASSGASRLGRQELDPSIVASTGPAAMLALLPTDFYGTTLSERPTILVYLPETGADQAVFSLKDEAGNTLYETALSIGKQAGVRAISMPANAPALEVGKTYQWFMALKIDDRLNPSTPYVDGWIKRVQPDAAMAAALNQADALEKAKILGEAGLWYDCAAILAGLRASQPTDQVLAKHWSELLSSVELSAIDQAPMLSALN